MKGWLLLKEGWHFVSTLPRKLDEIRHRSLYGCGFKQWICGELFYLFGEGKRRTTNSRSWIRCWHGNGRAFSQQASSCFLRQFFHVSEAFWWPFEGKNVFLWNSSYESERNASIGIDEREAENKGRESWPAWLPKMAWKERCIFLINECFTGRTLSACPMASERTRDHDRKAARSWCVHKTHGKCRPSYALSTTRDGNPESGTVISSGSCSTFPSATPVFWSRFVMVIKKGKDASDRRQDRTWDPTNQWLLATINCEWQWEPLFFFIFIVVRGGSTHAFMNFQPWLKLFSDYM